MAAIVTAGVGVPVCKHGNRAASSQCGTADVLEALGVVIDLGPAGVAACLERAGIGFCLAPRYHPAFRFAGPPRREIGVPTVFNLLGPLANPARVRHQLIGVADARFATQMLDTLRAHGSTSAWVVHGNGLDELSTTGISEVIALQHGEIRSFQVDPTTLGLAPASAEDLRGGDPHHNAAVVRSVLSGQLGAHRDVVVLNAAAALMVVGVAPDLETGLQMACASIDQGRAAEALNQLIAESGRQAEIERSEASKIL
jgi:anthranilate phosphoribosyltransferase